MSQHGNSINVTDTERDTILAALRHYQGTYHHLELTEIATNGGGHAELNAEDIDELCERINTVELKGGKDAAR